MRCPHCDSELSQDYRYCPHCGRPLDGSAEEGPVTLGDLVDEENAERAENGLPPVPGGSEKARSSAVPAVVAAVVVGLLVTLLAVIMAAGVTRALDTSDSPRWVSSGRPSAGPGGPAYGIEEGRGNAPRAESDEAATGRYYAFWQYGDELWGYVFDLHADGTGEFSLFLSEDGSFSEEDLVAKDFTEPLEWTQDGSAVTVSNPEGTDTLPDAPNGYVLSGEAGSRVLTPTDDSKYPNDPLYEDFDEAVANMT